jgi:hypothetical protein
MRFNRLGIMLAAGMAFVMFSALATTAAQATGPLWIVGSGGTSLAAGATRATTSINIGVFKLKGEVSVECTTVKSTGFLLGGNPGTDYSKITFTGCHLEGKTACTAKSVKPLAASNAGEIIVDALTILAFPVGSTTSALDAFAADGETGNPNLFVEFKLEGGIANCGALNNSEVKVEAKGTAIKIKGEERNCGVLAEVGKVSATETFELTASGGLAAAGALNFPTPALKKAELAGAAIECKLEVLNKPAEEVGLSKVTTSPEEVYGWDAT